MAALRSQKATRAAEQRQAGASAGHPQPELTAGAPAAAASAAAGIAVPSPRYKRPPSPPQRPSYTALDILDGGEVAVAVLERDGYFLLFRRIFCVLLEGFDDSTAEEDIGEAKNSGDEGTVGA